MGDSRLHKGYIGRSGGTYAVESPSRGLMLPANAVRSAGSSVRTEASEVMRGRVGLAALNFIILMMLGWYVWTKGVQGGR